MRKSSFAKAVAALLIASVILALCAVFAFASGSTAKEDEMTDIRTDFEDYLVQDTTRVEDDGYVGALEYTVYYDYAAYGKAVGGFNGTNAIVYAINTNTERVGTDSNKTIITDMLGKGYMVVVVDYLNNPLATGHALDDSAQMASQHVKFGHWIKASDKVTGVTDRDHTYFKTYVCPSGYNVLLDQVFWSIDKHSASGTLEKIVENWNTDFKGTKAERLVKWATGTTTDTRKTVANASDGSSPVWYNASGSVDSNGLYTKVKYTVANTITDCVNPDGSPLDMDLKMHVVYPTNPVNEVPVLSVSCCWEYPTVTNQCYTDLCSHHSGALFRGYAGAVYEYLWHPMAADDSFGYYDGNAAAGSVTHDHMNYSIHLYNDKLVNTASQRYLRYLALSDGDTYKFDLDKFACIGLSKGGWFTFLGDSELQTALVNPNDYSTEEEMEEAIDAALAAFTPRRQFDGHHGETRYQANETSEITGGVYTGEYAIDGGEKQPWLTYNGEEIISGVQLTYASNGSQEEDIAAGHVPMFIAAHMNDEYNAAYGSANASILASVSMDIPLIYFEVDQLHEFAYTPDMLYGVETYDAFFDFANFYLKNEPVKVFYTNPYTNDGDISVTDKIEILFSGEVKRSEVEKIVISDGVGSLGGSWSYTWGGTKWIFTPDRMKGNTTYTINIPADIKGVNGVAMGEAYTSSFITENDTATELTANYGTVGSYYTVTAPSAMPSGMDTLVFRFAVTNDAANVAELYAVESTSATDGTLIGKVNLKGAGIYEIDITEFAMSNPGKTATLLLKTGKTAGNTLIKESDFSTLTDVSTKSQAPYELIMVDKNGNEVATGGDSVISVYLNPRVYDAGDVNYENVTGVLNLNNIIGSSKVTDADYGRRFTIKLKYFDTESRTLQLRMSYMTSAALGVMDCEAPYYNVRTTAGEWNEFEFTYVVYDTEYGLGSNTTKTLYVNLSPSGNTNAPIYISHLTVTETVTDMTVTNAEIAAKSLGTAGFKTPTDTSAFSLYNGDSFVASYAGWKAALGAYVSGYTVKLNSDYTLVDGDLYSDFGTKAADITVDLNGYTIRCENTTNSLLWLKNTSASIGKTSVTLKNGGIVLGNKPLISYEDSTSGGAGKEFAVNLNDLKITLATRAMLTDLISSPSITSGATTDVTVRLNECDIDLGDEDKRATVMLTVFTEGESSLNVSYKITGGSLRMSHPRWITVQDSASVTDFIQGNDGYLKLYIPAPYAPSADDSYLTEDGYATYESVATVSNVTEYNLVAGENSTRYGVIPEEYQNYSKYHFAVFKEGVFIGAYSTWKDATAAAQTAVNSSKYIDSRAEIVMLADHDNTGDVGATINVATNILFDLGGHTFICEDVGFDLSANYTAAPYDTNITVTNGKVLVGRIAFFDSQFGGTQAGVKTYNVLSEGVTYGFYSGMTDYWGCMLHTCWGNPSGSNGMITNLDFKDCTIDLRSYPLQSSKAMSVFQANEGSNLYSINVNIEGGSILQDSLQNITFFKGGNSDDTVTMSKDDNGKYPTLTVTGSNTALAESFYTEDGNIRIFKASSTAGLYTLEVNSLASKYGVIPNSYSDTASYPFAVFKNGNFIGVYTSWNGATNAAQNAVNSSAYLTQTAVILLRSDYTIPTNGTDVAAAINKATNILVDLGGKTLTLGHTGFDLSGNYDEAPYKTTIKVINGTILNTRGVAVVDNQYAAGIATKKEYEITFTGVKFGYPSDANTDFSKNMLYTIWNNDRSSGGTKTLATFTDCTFDLKTNLPSNISSSNKLTLFQLDDGYKLCDVTVRVNGGNIITSDVFSINWSSLDSGDSVIYGKGSDGSYLTMTAPTTASYSASELHYRGAFDTAEGKMYFVEMLDDGTTSTFELQKMSWDGYGDVSGAASKFFSAVDFPFVVFKGSDYAGFSRWYEAINNAKSYASSEDKTAIIIMRRDYSAVKSKDSGSNFNTAKGNIILDLNGFTLTNVDDYFIDIYLNYANTDLLGFKSSIEIKNGTMLNQRSGAPMIAIGHTGSNDSYGAKEFGFTFTNVTFKVASGISTIIQEWTGDPHVGGGTDVDYVFTDCTFDFTGAPDDSVMFKLANSYNTSSAKFLGGKIIASDFSKYQLYSMNTDDTVFVDKGTDGKYPILTQPASAAYPTASYKDEDGKTISFKDGVASGSNKVYELALDIFTEYGYIPARYSSVEDYPFVVFKDGAFVLATPYFGRDNDSSALSSSKDEDSVILLRRDFVYSEETYNNLSQTKTNTVFDLGGFTFSSANIVFQAQKKTAFNTAFTVKNGTFLLTGSNPLMRLNAWGGGGYTGGNGFTFNFEDITVKLSATSTTKNLITTPASSGIGMYAVLNFTDCILDTTAVSTSDLYLFNVSCKDYDVDVSITGGEIKSNGFALMLDTEKHDSTTLTFVKTENGFTTVTLPSSADFESVTVNDGRYTFVEKSVDGNKTTYKLIPTAAVDLDFTPKASITLDSNLIFNIYIPEHAGLKSATLNGDTVTLGEAKDGYYLVSTELAAKEAAKELKLVVTLEIDGTSVKGTFTFSLTKYVSKILAADLSGEEKTLVKDILAYVRSAYVYFNGATDETAEIKAIDAVLADYSAEFSKVDGESSNTDGVLKGATFVLEATPRIRFYLPSGANVSEYVFKIGSEVLEYTADIETEAGDYNNLTYVDISLYAYRMIDTITITKGDSTSYYHINSYYDFVSGSEYTEDDKEALTDLVEKFYTYCKSADAYRTYVLENQ